MRHQALSLLLLLALAAAHPACDDESPDGDGDTDIDGDSDADVDGDTDVDGDSDGDVDGDGDVEVEEADHYVAPDGDDENPGTEELPFATVQRAADLAEAGDLIYLRGGTYHPTAQTLFRRDGAAGQPIVLRAYPGEAVVIDASGLPEGDIDGGSTPTWLWDGAEHWEVIGPIHLTNGRGAGLVIEGETRDVDFTLVESSYNGQRAARAGHGFLIVEAEWADVEDLRFINCDAHHNANHLARAGEDLAENQYQHGDGFRIKSGREVQLIGCRAWNNLDDGYDLVWAADPVVLTDCWAAYTGYDDAEGSITGTAGWEAAWGEGIKLGYTTDLGEHRCLRCLSIRNVHLGYRMDGGPNELLNCTSYHNGRRALGWDLGDRDHLLTNCLDYDSYRDSTIPPTTTSTHNSWDEATGVTVTEEDFLSVDEAGLFGPRGADGGLPVTDFLRLAPGSDLIDAGLEVGLAFSGSAPDLGCFESP